MLTIESLIVVLSFGLTRYSLVSKRIKTTSLAGGLSTAYKAAVTSLALKGPLIKI